MTNILLAALPIIAALETKGIAAISAAIAISCGAIGSTAAMGKATSSALEAGARQPEIISKLQTPSTFTQPSILTTWLLL